MFILWGSKLKLFIEQKQFFERETLQLRSEVRFLQDSLEQERSERRELNNLILQRAGFISFANPTSSESLGQPLGKPVSSWRETRSKLEKNSILQRKVVPLEENELGNKIKEMENEVLGEANAIAK